MADSHDQTLDMIERTLRWAADQADSPAIADIRQDSEGILFLACPGDRRWRLSLELVEEIDVKAEIERRRQPAMSDEDFRALGLTDNLERALVGQHVERLDTGAWRVSAAMPYATLGALRKRGLVTGNTRRRRGPALSLLTEKGYEARRYIKERDDAR